MFLMSQANLLEKRAAPSNFSGSTPPRIRIHDLRDTDAMPYQLSYEATHWERGQLFISPVRCEMM